MVTGDGGAQGNSVLSEPVADALQIDEEEIDGDWAESTVELAKEDSDGSPDHYLCRRGEGGGYLRNEECSGYCIKQYSRVT